MILSVESPVKLEQPKKFSVDFWHAPAVIAENNFIYKSLSNWAFNVAVGCSHACRFCYVPSAATIKQGARLAEYGVKDPDAEWGDYLLLRPWDEEKFLASLRSAENTPRKQLKPDGNRAVIYCSTTDPYQVIHHPDPARQRELAEHARFLVRRSLELIRNESTLNVRILTRSPLAIVASVSPRFTVYHFSEAVSAGVASASLASIVAAVPLGTLMS